MLAYAKPGSLTCRRPGLQQQLPASRSAISFRVLSQKSGIIVHSGGRQSPAVLRATESTESASALDRQPSTSYASRRESTEVPAPRDRPWKRVLGKLAKAAAVGGLCFALALSSVGPALAARSGGYMGGSNFRSGLGGSRLGGSSAGSSFGGGFGGGSSLGGGLSHSYRGGAPGLTGNSLSMRRAGPSVRMNSFGWFGPPVYYGGGYGAPVAGGGGGFGNVLLLGILAAVVWTAFTSFAGDSAGGEYAGEKVTVAKLQVGLLGSAKQMKRDLDRIADRANTDTPSGLHYILQETTLALLRNPDYCIYGAATTNNKRGLEAGESAFNRLSMEERGKFSQETLVNVGGRRRSGRLGSGSNGGRGGTNELIVVTILAAVEGRVKLPKVTSLEELRTALNQLGSIGKDRTLAVEVLWTPQDEDDYYTRDEIFQDYPTLNNL